MAINVPQAHIPRIKALTLIYKACLSRLKIRNCFSLALAKYQNKINGSYARSDAHNTMLTTS
jgi:hypothetical protein